MGGRAPGAPPLDPPMFTNIMVQMMKKTANVLEYKVDINAIIASFVYL